MSKAMAALAVRLEQLSIVHNISTRLKIPVLNLLRIAAILLGVVLLAILYLGIAQPGWLPGASANTELLRGAGDEGLVASAAIKLPTEFDDAVLDGTGSTTVEPQLVVVYVTGAVTAPGLYTLQSQQRIGDAVQAAGGLLPEAALAAVNLAQELADGMQIHIPRLDEVAANAPSAAVTGTAVGGGTGSAGDTANALVNINTADITTLQTLNGIGPATAQKIIDYRAANGSFRSKEDLKQVSGIGDKKYAAIEAHITV